MCNSCSTTSRDSNGTRICTHKDFDRACGCVECLHCEITMIQCKNHPQCRDPRWLWEQHQAKMDRLGIE